MRKITLFGLMTFCAIITSFAQTPKDVSAFRLKTAIASRTMAYFEVNSPDEEFYVDRGDGFKKRYAAGNYAYPNPVYSDNHKKEAQDKGRILDVEPANAKARFVMKVAGEAGATVSLKVAGVEDKLSVIVGDGEAKEYTVSTDITKLTPINVTTTAKDQFVVVEGDLLAMNCKGNKLSTIDCASAAKLVMLDCSDNQLGQLDISGLKSAKYIYFMNNKITNLIVGELPLLEELNASFNGLNSINLTKLPALKALSVDNNSISNLVVDRNTKLEALYCKKNKMQNLDVTMLPNLKELSASHNRLSAIDLSKNTELEELDLKDNSLTDLDLTNNINLEEINVSENKLASLDLSKCTKLTELYCYTNVLTDLDLSANKKLEEVSCGDNKLAVLNFEGFQELSSLAAMFNNLTSVNVKNCPELKAVVLDHNELDNLDFTGCENLRLVDIAINTFSVGNALKMIATLPEASADEKGYVIYWNKEEYPDDEEGNVFDNELSIKADAKNWVIANGEKNPLSIEELTISGDAKQLLTIAADKITINGAYTDAKIFSVNGREVATLKGEKEVSVAQLAAGIYVIKVKANGRKVSAKFIVK